MATGKLFLKLIIFCGIFAVTYIFAMWQVAQGQVDYYYSKFTHQAGSLILGISRANDGISPAVIEQTFGSEEIAYPVLNFAFAHQTSDFGPAYFEAIQKKVIPGTTNGLFIIEVSPASLSVLKSETDTTTLLKDNQSFLVNMRRLNQHPNYEYLRKMYSQSLYSGFQKSRRIDKIRFSHPDGWQEVSMENESYKVAPEEVAKWKAQKLNEAEKMSDYFKPSDARLLYLQKTIAFLQGHGYVFLVRMPLSEEFLEIENAVWPEFNTRIEEIGVRFDVVYFDYSMYGEEYETYDGSHFFGSSAVSFTSRLCNDIASTQLFVNR